MVTESTAQELKPGNVISFFGTESRVMEMRDSEFEPELYVYITVHSSTGFIREHMFAKNGTVWVLTD